MSIQLHRMLWMGHIQILLFMCANSLIDEEHYNRIMLIPVSHRLDKYFGAFSALVFPNTHTSF